MMKRIPIFELVCTAAVLALAAIWFKTGANVLPALLFWLLLLAFLLAARINSRITWWLQICLVVAVLANNTLSWRQGNLSTIQFIALTILFLGCVAWIYLSRLMEDEDNDQKEAFEQSSGGDSSTRADAGPEPPQK
jgi:hypothetical protein